MSGPDAVSPGRGSGEGRAGGAADADVERRVMEALRGVVDPEVGLDVVTLGLIYEVDATGDGVHIRYTLTTRGCPMGGVLEEGIVAAARGVEGVREVETELVWEPGWNPGMIEDDAWG